MSELRHTLSAPFHNQTAAQIISTTTQGRLGRTCSASVIAHSSTVSAQSIRSAASTAHMDRAISPADPVIAFAKILAGLCELKAGTSAEKAFLQQLQYWFNAGTEILDCQFLGVTLDLKISRESLDTLDVKAETSQAQLDRELTATLLDWCGQAKIIDARRDFISSKKYLVKLREDDVSLADIHVLRRLCQSPPAGFNLVAFIQQFTDASHGSAGQCGAQESLQMHRILLRASVGYFHQTQISEQDVITSDLMAETKLAVWNYCERLIHQAMQSAGQVSENRRNFEIHLQTLCQLGQVTIDQYTVQINPIAMAHEVVIRINQLMGQERAQRRVILTAMQLPIQDVLLTDEHDSIGKALCNKGTIAHISSVQPTIRSILQWLSTCGVFQLQPTRNPEKNYAHLADLFHQLNELETKEQKICYAALSAIPIFHPSPLLWAIKSGDRRLLETLTRISGESAQQLINEKTLLHHVLDSANQEVFDSLNRVIGDKNYLATELHQLFEQPVSAERNRKILMFSEVSWLKESKYKELRLKIVKLQQSMRAGYVQQQRSPQEMNRVLIEALMENDQDQVDLLLDEMQERNITFDSTQMTTTVLDQLGHERAQRILGFMQTRQIALSGRVVNAYLIDRVRNIPRLEALIKFSIDQRMQINRTQLSQSFTKALCTHIMQSTQYGDTSNSLQEMTQFAENNKYGIALNNDALTEVILFCLSGHQIEGLKKTWNSISVGKAMAQNIVSFAKDHGLAPNAELFARDILQSLQGAETVHPPFTSYFDEMMHSTLTQLRHGLHAADVISASYVLLFAMENSISIEKTLAQPWTWALSHLLNSGDTDNIIYAQQAAESAVQQQVPLDRGALTAPWTHAIATCLSRSNEATAQQLADFSKRYEINLSSADFTQHVVNCFDLRNFSANDFILGNFSGHSQVMVARLMGAFAHRNEIALDRETFTRGISEKLSSIHSREIDHLTTMAQQMVIFAEGSSIEVDRAGLSKPWSTAVSAILTGYNPADIIRAFTTAQKAIEFAEKNQISLESSVSSQLFTHLIFIYIDQDNIAGAADLIQHAESKIPIELYINPVIAAGHSIRRVGAQDVLYLDLKTTQQLINSASGRNIKVQLKTEELAAVFPTLLINIQADDSVLQKENLTTIKNLMQFLIRNQIKIPLDHQIIEDAIRFLSNEITRGNQALPYLEIAQLLIASTQINAMESQAAQQFIQFIEIYRHFGEEI